MAFVRTDHSFCDFQEVAIVYTVIYTKVYGRAQWRHKFNTQIFKSYLNYFDVKGKSSFDLKKKFIATSLIPLYQPIHVSVLDNLQREFLRGLIY